MHISNSVGQSKLFGPQPTSNISNKTITPIKESVRSVDAEKEQSPSKQTTPSIVIDEQALALYQQSQESAASQSNKTSSAFDSSSTDQDQPSAKNESAVASYQAVGNLAQRESVQQLFGVDLFA